MGSKKGEIIDAGDWCVALQNCRIDVQPCSVHKGVYVGVKHRGIFAPLRISCNYLKNTV